MPWKEIHVVQQRQAFIEEWLRKDEPVIVLCARFGVSRKAGYKWIERFRQGGMANLVDRSRAPRSRPHTTPEQLAEAVVRLRKKQRFWGPRKLRAWLVSRFPDERWPAPSTIGDLLKARGLIEPVRRRPRVPLSSQPLAAATAPNVVWSADFKGCFRVAGRICNPLTISDNFSRMLLRVERVETLREEHVAPIFDTAFQEYGMPWRIRTDNGAPFATRSPGGLSRLSVKWVKMGIIPERIEPGKPQQNGRHERMHRTLKLETASPPKPSMTLQQQAFDDFRRNYNEQRPHQALGQKTPASLYTPSPRIPPRELPDPEYPDHFELRRVFRQGSISCNRNHLSVGRVLAHEVVALEPIRDGIWQVWFGPIYLGMIRQLSKGRSEFTKNITE